MKGIILIPIALLLFGCAEEQARNAADKPLVYVSIPPMAGLLRQIAGDHLIRYPADNKAH